MITQAKTIIINEFLATKSTDQWQDEDGDASDWIELYNPTNRVVSLKEYALTDRRTEHNPWQFPTVTVNPKGYLLIWASDKNRRAGKSLHTNFTIDRHGGALYLMDPKGNVMDSVKFGTQERNVSYGRCSDEPGNWCYFPNPSPGKPNPNSGHGRILGTVTTPTCSLNEVSTSDLLELVFEAPADGSPIHEMVFETSTRGATIHYTLNGYIPTTNSREYTRPLVFPQTFAIRARAFKENYLPSSIVTRTYLVGEQHTFSRSQSPHKAL